MLWWCRHELVQWPLCWGWIVQAGVSIPVCLDTTTTIRIARQMAVGSHALLLGPMRFLGNFQVKELYHREFEQLLS